MGKTNIQYWGDGKYFLQCEITEFIKRERNYSHEDSNKEIEFEGCSFSIITDVLESLGINFIIDDFTSWQLIFSKIFYYNNRKFLFNGNLYLGTFSLKLIE